MLVDKTRLVYAGIHPKRGPVLIVRRNYTMEFLLQYSRVGFLVMMFGYAFMAIFACFQLVPRIARCWRTVPMSHIGLICLLTFATLGFVYFTPFRFDASLCAAIVLPLLVVLLTVFTACRYASYTRSNSFDPMFWFLLPISIVSCTAFCSFFVVSVFSN